MTTTHGESPKMARPSAFTGWYRATSRQPWQAVCHADSEREAWDLLLARKDSGDKCVLPAGRDPNDGKRPRG